MVVYMIPQYTYLSSICRQYSVLGHVVHKSLNSFIFSFYLIITSPIAATSTFLENRFILIIQLNILPYFNLTTPYSLEKCFVVFVASIK